MIDWNDYLMMDQQRTLQGYTDGSQHVREQTRQAVARCSMQTFRLQRSLEEHGKWCRTAIKPASFPPGWDEEWVRKVLAHDAEQTADEAMVEDEAVLVKSPQTVMEVPHALVPTMREFLAKH